MNSFIPRLTDLTVITGSSAVVITGVFAARALLTLTSQSLPDTAVRIADFSKLKREEVGDPAILSVEDISPAAANAGRRQAEESHCRSIDRTPRG